MFSLSLFAFRLLLDALRSAGRLGAKLARFGARRPRAVNQRRHDRRQTGDTIRLFAALVPHELFLSAHVSLRTQTHTNKHTQRERKKQKSIIANTSLSVLALKHLSENAAQIVVTAGHIVLDVEEVRRIHVHLHDRHTLTVTRLDLRVVQTTARLGADRCQQVVQLLQIVRRSQHRVEQQRHVANRHGNLRHETRRRSVCHQLCIHNNLQPATQTQTTEQRRRVRQLLQHAHIETSLSARML